MNARTKLCWVDIPRRSLREGLACEAGGARILLMVGDDSRPVVPSAAITPPDGRPADKPS